MKNGMQRGELRAVVDRLTVRPDGMLNSDLAQAIGVTINKASSKARMMGHRGTIFEARRDGGVIHWFDTAERAKAWGNNSPKMTAPVKKTGNLHSLSRGKKPGPPALTGYYTAGASKMASFKADAPVDASGAKFTICPSGMDFRFTARPEEVTPLFASMGVGRYLQEVAA